MRYANPAYNSNHCRPDELWRLCDVGSGNIQQRHFFAVQQLLNVDQNQHPVTQRTQSRQIFRRQRDRKLRCRTDLIRCNPHRSG